MATHVHDREVYVYVFWPIPIQTPRWFDDACFGLSLRLWAWMRSKGLIRCHRVGD